MPYAVTIGVTVEPDDGEDIEALLDRVLDELEALGVRDAGYVGSLAQHEFEISMLLVDVEGLEEAHQAGMTALRAAIHAAGGGTPGWPVFSRWSLGAERIDHERGADRITV